MEKEILERLIIYVLKLLAKRQYSEGELRTRLTRYMYKKRIEDRELYTNEVVEFLRKKKFLNDTFVAEAFVRDRQLLKPKSLKMLRMELKQKGLAPELIEKALEQYDEEKAMKALIHKKKHAYSEEELTRYLLGKGFPYDLTQETVKNKLTAKLDYDDIMGV